MDKKNKIKNSQNYIINNTRKNHIIHNENIKK